MKSQLFYLTLLLASNSIIVKAYRPCPILGLGFTAPKNLCSSSTIQAAAENLTNVINSAVLTGNTTHGVLRSNTSSFSIEIFTAHNATPLYNYHHSSPILAKGASGVKNVDSNSIYRIGSITKLFTVYTYLLQTGFKYFDEPITKFVPELLEATRTRNSSDNPIDNVAWEDITIRDLASYMADIGRDSSTLGELTQSGLSLSQFVEGYGLPPLQNSEIPPCGALTACDRTAFFASWIQRHPSFAPSTTPSYSNIAFQLLGYALENITNKTFESLVNENIVDKLSLSYTTYFQPANSSNGVIPIDKTNSGWNLPAADLTPAGGMFSSVSDLSKLGRSILTSQFITPLQTRRWLKPLSFTSDPAGTSVGAPWEIRRLQLPSRVVDLYTKSGDLGLYHGMFVVIPDWDIGFSVLVAGGDGEQNFDVSILSDIIAEVFLPAVETAAREEVEGAYAGHYTDETPGLNSSITLTTTPGVPGLEVSQFISNSTEMLSVLGSIALNTADKARVSMRLYPTGLKTKTANGNTVLGFRAAFGDTKTFPDTGIFSNTCGTWFTIDQKAYGRVSIDEFLLTVGEDGVAKSIEPRVLRTTMIRST